MATISNRNNNFLELILWILVAVFICFLVSSCSCNYHMRQIKKKCKSTELTEVITIHDTVKISETKRDTIFKFTHTSDTIRLNQDRLHIKYFYNTHDSTVYLAGKCDSIIKIKEVQVPFKVTKYLYNWFAEFRWYFIFTFILLFLFLVLRYVLKK